MDKNNSKRKRLDSSDDDIMLIAEGDSRRNESIEVQELDDEEENNSHTKLKKSQIPADSNLKNNSISGLEKDAMLTTVAPKNFIMLTWNIDGIESSNLKRRSRVIIKTITKEKCDIVFLQEVVPNVYHYLEKELPQYMLIASSDTEYFTVTMLLRTIVHFDGHELVDFPGSLMGRNLLVVKAHIGDCHLELYNSHLESTAEFSKERKIQLAIGFSYVTNAPPNANAILAGDLNMRDQEVAAVGIPKQTVDVWEFTGSRKEVKWTWDLSRNCNKQVSGKYNPRCRFDRIYCRRSSRGSSIVPRYFGLVGLEKVPNTQCFPSDHWGLLTHYVINDKPS